MHLGAVTFNVLKDWDVETIITKLEELGYEAVELRTSHAHGVEPSIDPTRRAEVRERFKHSKVRLLAYGTACEFHSPDEAERRAQVEMAKQFVDLAKDTGAWGVKVRPNNLPEGVPREVTVKRIGEALIEVGEYAEKCGIEVWLEVHGRETQHPDVIAEIMRIGGRHNVGVCWNCNAPDITDGSIKPNFELLKPWIKHVHMHDLTDDYPYRELFALLRGTNYDRYTLIEAPASPEPERFLKYYRALWLELNRP